jgi:hypothetical protein
MISFKIIEKINSVRQPTEVIMSLEQTQSVFDRLCTEIAPPHSWKNLYVFENGIFVVRWRVEAPSGATYAPHVCKARVDKYFQDLYTKQDRPVVELRLSHTYTTA